MGVNYQELNGDAQVTTGAAVLFGYSLRSAGATPVTTKLTVRDGINGDIVVVLNMAAGESVRDWFGPQGISFPHGIYVDVETGVPEGSLYFE